MFGLSPLPDAVARGIVLTAAMLGWIILLVRVVGLRAFSKMTAFDFVTTLATGSLLATAATSGSWAAYVQAAVAVLALLSLQYVIARIRRQSDTARQAIENRPLLLMRDGAFIDAALRTGRVRRSDVIAKLREANALDLSRVHAVVLETTGDISVLHGGEGVDPLLLEGIATA